jgi:hypothetical protein
MKGFTRMTGSPVLSSVNALDLYRDFDFALSWSGLLPDIPPEQDSLLLRD